MDLDLGKKLFNSFTEAEQVAIKMRRTHKEAYVPYKVGSQWAVGGSHTKTLNKRAKVNSLDDIRILLNPYKESEEDNSVEDYISEIESESKVKVSTAQGEDLAWTLKHVDIKLGCDIDMSVNNRNQYLVLTLEKGINKLTLKMGGKFSRHIPLIKKQALGLINTEIIWHTWNNSNSNWESNEWFYLIQNSS